jgi:ribosomal protein L37E
MAQKRFDNSVREFAKQRESNIQDGKHNNISCSACGESLVEIWVIRPEAEVTTDIIVECPFCGDASFPVRITGQYCIGYAEGSKARMTNMTIDGDTLQKVRVHTEMR